LTQQISQFDLAIAGGGLAAYLTAAIVLKKCPTLQIAIVEKHQNREQHTWSFHAKDLSQGALDLLSPLISQKWNDYLVKFPDHERKIDLEYCSIRSKDFWEKIGKMTENVTKIVGDVSEVEKTELRFNNQGVIKASVVLDARGVSPGEFTANSGWQKFIGFEIETEEEHGITCPTIMDATVEQSDGYRFFYILPFSKNTLLVEDTYYSDNKLLNVQTIENEIERYIRKLGIVAYKITAKESGALPIPLNHSYLLSGGNLPEIGMRGGFFHPTSGYSLPFSISCAEQLAAQIFYAKHVHSDLFEKSQQSVYRSRMALFKSAKFLIRLNRMFFRAANPNRRWHVLSQFYRKDIRTITEFYSGQLSLKTKLSMITGVPPVPVISGLKHFFSDHIVKEPMERAIHG
jgi:lycopene beta-cyclase